MAENKKSFILYADQIEMWESLSDEQAGKLMKHIIKYVNDLNPTTNDQFVKLAFSLIKPTLKRDLQKWDEVRSKRADAGRIGGLKSGQIRQQNEANEANASNAKQNGANEAVSVSVNVNDSVTVNANVNANVTANENEKNKKTHTDLTAYQFLFQNAPIQLEQLWMKNSKFIAQKDFIIETFNDKAVLEEIPYDEKKLIARLSMLIRNWKNETTTTGLKPIFQLTENEIMGMPFHKMQEYGQAGIDEIQALKREIYKRNGYN